VTYLKKHAMEEHGEYRYISTHAKPFKDEKQTALFKVLASSDRV